jgi:CIC family chloride channel protein
LLTQCVDLMPNLTSYLEKLPRNGRSILLTLIYGLTGGLAAVIFEVGINFFFAGTFQRLSKCSTAEFLGGTFGVIVVTSIIAGYLLNRFCPEAAGSGIPQLKVAFWKDFGYVPVRVIWVKFVAGLLTVGGGASLGREGPTVQLAGAAASNLAGRLGVAKNGRRLAAVAGAAAGLAAAFNAPLASITFVLEEIIEDLNSRLLGSILFAAVLGALTVQAFLGSRPAFDLPQIDLPTWRGYLLAPLGAVLASLVGVVFQVGTLSLRRKLRQPSWRALPGWLRPTLGGLITWVIGCAVFLRTGHLGIFSLGYQDLTAALNDRLGWELAGVLVVGKLVATICGYGTGGCGGIFAPNLFLGAMCGVTLAGVCRAAGLHLTFNDHVLVSVVAMSACLGAVVRAPLTSILIVFEMTHEFALVPALLAGALISQATSRALLSHGFYEQALVDDGQVLRTVMPPRDLRSWRQYPVSAIANFHPFVLSSDDLSAAALPAALADHPYDRFPVAADAAAGRPPSVLLREEALAALAAGQPPAIHEAPTCLRDETIGQAQALLIESAHGMVLVLEAADGLIVGLLTLHDLLRAQDALAQQADAFGDVPRPA